MGSWQSGDTWGQWLRGHHSQKMPRTDVNRAGKCSEKGSYRNTASSGFPRALAPNVLHLSFMVIKTQQSH